MSLWPQSSSHQLRGLLLEKPSETKYPQVLMGIVKAAFESGWLVHPTAESALSCSMKAISFQFDSCLLVMGTVNSGTPPGTKCPQVRFMAFSGCWWGPVPVTQCSSRDRGFYWYYGNGCPHCTIEEDLRSIPSSIESSYDQLSTCHKNLGTNGRCHSYLLSTSLHQVTCLTQTSHNALEEIPELWQDFSQWPWG